MTHVANLPDRPAPRKSGEEVEGMFRDHDFMETLDLLDIWPPDHAIERYFNFEDST